MQNSPTEGEQVTPASQEPTGQEQVQQPAAEQSNQETNSGANTQGSVSDDTANQNQTQTQQTGGASQTDDGLAKFAKSQNIDLENATENEKRLLKVALDNQKAARSNTPSKSIVDATSELGDGSLQADVANLKYERTTDKFWQGEGRDRSLESSMVEILAEKAEQFGKEYAFNLSRDLDTLYGMAQLKSGSTQKPVVDEEAIRRETRESMNQSLNAGAAPAHATQGGQSSKPQITSEWLINEYDKRNPEHVQIMRDAGLY